MTSSCQDDYDGGGGGCGDEYVVMVVEIINA